MVRCLDVEKKCNEKIYKMKDGMKNVTKTVTLL